MVIHSLFMYVLVISMSAVREEAMHLGLFPRPRIARTRQP